MSHVHDLDDLEMDVSWCNEAGESSFVPIGGPEDGITKWAEDCEWYLGIDVGPACCLEVPISRILELLEEAKKSKKRFARHVPEQVGLEGARCCRADPVTS